MSTGSIRRQPSEPLALDGTGPPNGLDPGNRLLLGHRRRGEMIERFTLPLARIALVLVVVVATPVVFHLPLPASGRLPEILAWALLLLSGLRLLALAFSSQPRLMDISFWLFVFTFFGVAPITQIYHNTYALPVPAPYSDSELTATEVRIIVGIAAYCAGRWVFRHTHLFARASRAWSGLRVSVRRCQVLGALGVLISLAVIAQVGIRPFFTSRDSLTASLYGTSGTAIGLGNTYDVASKGAGAFRQLATTIPVFVVLVYLLLTGGWRRHRLLFIAVLAVAVVTENPISNSRAWTAVVLAGVLGAFVNLANRRRHVYLALGLLTITLFSFSYLSFFRVPASYRTGNVAAPQTNILQSLDYAMFQQEVNATTYIQQHGFTHGRQLLGAALVYVPHSVWHNKPPNTDSLVFQDPAADLNLSSSLWTEFYIDFGYPVLCLGFLVVGGLYAYLDDVFWRMRMRSGPAQVIVPIAAAYSLLFLRGSLQPTLGYGVPLFVLLFLCLRRAHRSQQAFSQSKLSKNHAEIG